MRVVIAEPPLFDQISTRFNVAGKPVIFCFGSTIYNPMAVEIGPELLAHEAVHAEQQGADIEGWWRRYLFDDAFRLEQEIPAHRAEYLAYIEHNEPDRRGRRIYLRHVAERLASPLYGGLMTFEAAKKAIKA